MGWADYTFTKLEMCYAGDAVEAIQLQIQGNREHNKRKLSAAEEHCQSLLSDDNLPPVWKSMLNMAMASLDKPLWREYFKAGVAAWKQTGRGPGNKLWEDMKRKMAVLEKGMLEWERNGCQFSPSGKREGRKGRNEKGKSFKDGMVISESGKDERKLETT